jgi:hypothetical protein
VLRQPPPGGVQLEPPLRLRPIADPFPAQQVRVLVDPGTLDSKLTRELARCKQFGLPLRLAGPYQLRDALRDRLDGL